MDNFASKGTAVVSGGSSGLGLAAADRLKYEGYRVVILDRNIDEELSRRFDAQYLLDISDEGAVGRALSQSSEELGPIRVVVSAAGIIRAGRLISARGSAVSLTDVRRVLETNLLGTFTLLTLAAERMRLNAQDADGQRGVLVTVGSIASRDCQSGTAAYAASKAGVSALSQVVARDLASWGIRCVCIAPGTFATPLSEAIPANVQESLLANSVFPKRFGRAVEFAELVSAVIDNVYLNGATLELDGAARMPIYA